MSSTAPFPVRRRSRLLGGVALALSGALLLSACSIRKQYGVTTTLVAGHGTCDGNRQVELGVGMDLSGPQGSLGREYLDGIRLAVADVNRHRGVLKNHSCLEILYKNTAGSVRVADKAVLDLVNNEVVSFLIGPFGADEVSFSGADLGLSGVPTTSLSSLDTTTHPHAYPQLFPVVPGQAVSARMAVAYARSKQWSRVAVVGEPNAAGREGVADFVAQAGHRGMTVTGRAQGRSYQSELRSLEGGQPEALYLAGDDLGVLPILQARHDMGWNVPVIAPQAAADQAVVSALGPGGVSGVVAVAPAALVVHGPTGVPSDPSVAAFVRAMAAKLGSGYAGSLAGYGEAYDAVELLAYVVNSINSTHPGDVRTFIENANYQGLMASYGYTGAKHEGMNSAQLGVAPLSSLSGGLFHT